MRGWPRAGAHFAIPTVGRNKPLTPTSAKASAFAQATADKTAGRLALFRKGDGLNGGDHQIAATPHPCALSRLEREWLGGA